MRPWSEPYGSWMSRMLAVKKLIENCERKRVYRSHGRAIIAGRQRGLSPYRCNVCGDWHLTSRKD